MAPTAAPIAISIKLASLIFPGLPKLKASGLIKAEIATKILQLIQLNCGNQQLILASQSLEFYML